MKVNDFTQPLHEAPLPDEWDKGVFTPATSFKKKIDYAVRAAQRLRGGSARVAFIIPYQGRETVLKIAKNKKGLAQNEFEASILSSPYAQQYGVTIPMIDYDEEHDEPIWIHMEKANKVTAAKFRKYYGGDPDDVEQFLRYHTGQYHWHKKEDIEYLERLREKNNGLDRLVQFVVDHDLPTGDFSRLSSWGEYKGHIVLLDVGLSWDIAYHHYGIIRRRW